MLRHTELAISGLALGTMTFGDPTDEKTAWKMADLSAETGGDLLGTEDIYSLGVTDLKQRSREI